MEAARISPDSRASGRTGHREPHGPSPGRTPDGGGPALDPLAALGESERRYRELFNSIRDAILVADTNRRIIDCNPAFTELFGYTLAEIRGIETVVVYKNQAEFLTMGEKIRERMHDPGFVHTVRYRTRTGRVFPGETNVFHLSSEEGELHGFIGQIRDVSDQEETEEALRESEERYRALYENAPLPYQSLDRTGRILDVNPQWLATLGFQWDEVVGAPFTKFLHPDSASHFPSCFRRLLREGSVDDIQHRMVTRSGRTLHVSFRGRVGCGGTGGKQRTYCVFQDITRRREAEAERDRLISAVEQLNDGVVITDLAGSILYANPALSEMTGYAREEVMGKNPRIFKSGKHDTLFYREMWSTILGGRTWTGRMVNRRKGGSLYTEDAIISPVRDSGGRTTNYVAVKRDITEQLRLQEEKDLLEARYHQSLKLEAIGQLAGGVAHDLNNMLSPILGYAEILAQGAAEGADVEESAMEIVEAGKRARDLVSQLLAFSRRQPLAVSVLDLNEVVRGFGSLLRRTTREDINLEYELAREPLPIRGDRGQLEQVLLNLTLNAQDALPGGGAVTIRSRMVELDAAQAIHHTGGHPGAYAVLVVRDTGVGMDSDTRNRIFEPFFTTKEQGRGTGLGLATVYGIVKQHEGEITVASTPGTGSVFTCYFPLVADLPEVQDPPGSSVSEDQGTETVMVVEDETMVRRVAVRALQQRGFRVLQAADGEECLEILSGYPGPLHLLLTDVILPGMDGRQLSEQVRERIPTIQTLYVSGYAGDVLSHRGVLGEGIAFLQKPFSPGTLAAKVRAVLDSVTQNG